MKYTSRNLNSFGICRPLRETINEIIYSCYLHILYVSRLPKNELSRLQRNVQ